MSSNLSQLLIVSLALIVVIEAGFIAARRPTVAALLTLGVVALDASGTVVSVKLGATNVYSADAVCIMLAIAIALRSLRSDKGLHASVVWLLLLGFTAFSLVRGSAAFGFQHAVNDLRDHVYLFVAAAYFASFRPRPELVSALLRRWVWAGVVLSGIAVVFWMQHGFGTYGATPAGSATADRALVSSTSLIVAQAAVISIVVRRRPTVWAKLLPLTLLMVVVLTDQRTVWAATTTTVVVLALIRTGGDKKARRRARLVAVGGLAAIGILVLTGPPDISNSLNRATTEATAQDSTLQWRFDRWGQLLDQQLQDPVDIAIGAPAGQSSTREVGSIRLFAFHNFYLQTAAFLGVIGLLALLALFAWLALGLIRAKRSAQLPGSHAGLLLALLAGQVVFMGAYGLDISQGILLGIATSLAVAARAQPPVGNIAQAKTAAR